jgi:hypothetical protein
MESIQRKKAMKKIIIMMVMGILINGCATAWYKDEANKKQIKNDVAACKIKVNNLISENKVLYENRKKALAECMTGKGYHPIDRDELGRKLQDQYWKDRERKIN